MLPQRDLRARAHGAALRDEAEAIALANETDYGLAATVYTGDASAPRVGEQLVAGTVWVNCFFVRDLEHRSVARSPRASAARAAGGASTSTRT